MITNSRPRHRIEQSPESLLLKTYVNVASSGATPRTVVDRVTYRPSTKVVDDVVNHEFKKRVSEGEVFNNPYSKHSVETYIEGTHNFHYASGNGYSDSISDAGIFLLSKLNGASVPPVSISGEEESDRNAQIEVLGSINRTEFDSATFFAEWHKTKQLHRDVGNAILKVFLNPQKVTSVIRDVVKRIPLYDDKGRPLLNRSGKPLYKYSHVAPAVKVNRSRSKDAANLYLVGRYGVGPLLHDLEDACKYLTRSKALRKTARGGYTVSGHAEGKDTFIGGVFVTETCSVDIQHVVTRQKRYGILYETEAFMSGVAQAGLSRPLSTLWELTPWSFVFDWFLNVGAWLDAIQPSLASKTLSAWVSTMELDIVSVIINANSGDVSRPQYADSWQWGASGTARRKITSYNRNPWHTSTPTFPGLGSGLNPLRSFDFANLILQRIGLKRTLK